MYFIYCEYELERVETLRAK